MTTAGAALEQGLKPPTVRVSCQRNPRGLRMAEPCFQPGKIVLPGNENLCLKRSELIGRPRGPDEGPMTAINMLAAISGTKSLAVLDGVRPESLGGLGGREADRRPGGDAGGDAGAAQARGARRRYGGRARAAGQRGGEGAGAAELFPASLGIFLKTAAASSASSSSALRCSGVANLFTSSIVSAVLKRLRT